MLKKKLITFYYVLLFNINNFVKKIKRTTILQYATCLLIAQKQKLSKNNPVMKELASSFYPSCQDTILQQKREENNVIKIMKFTRKNEIPRGNQSWGSLNDRF